MNFDQILAVIKSLKQSAQQYPENVAANKQELPPPFFNNSGNNPQQWLQKVLADTRQRGPFEGMQDLTNPIIQNPSIYPYVEPIIGAARTANYKAGKPNWLLNEILGQTAHTRPGEQY